MKTNSLLGVGRYIFKSDWTISHLLINKKNTYFGIEDEIRNVKVHGETAIDYGVYKLGTRYSPKFSSEFFYNEKLNKLIHKSEYKNITDKEDYKEHELIWVMEVPKFNYILLHWGNTDDNTEGCYIMGDRIGILNGQDAVLNSKNTYKAFYMKVFPLIKKGGQTIEYFKEDVKINTA